MPSLFMVELSVSNIHESISWYQRALGVEPQLTDMTNGFALFETASGRVALKEGQPESGGVKLIFHVIDIIEELARLSEIGLMIEGDIKQSDEGYRRIFLLDPDGYRIGFFDWVR